MTDTEHTGAAVHRAKPKGQGIEGFTLVVHFVELLVVECVALAVLRG